MNQSYQSLKTRIRWHRPMLFLSSIVCNLVIFLYSACIAFCIRKILNAVQNGSAKDFSTNVFPWLAFMAIAVVIRILAMKISAVLDSVITFEAENTLRHNIFHLALLRKNLLKLAASRNKVFESLDDDVPKCVFPATLLSEVLGYVGYTITAVVTLLIINWKVTLFIFIPLSLAILLVQLLSKWLKANRLSNRRIHEQITDTVSHITEMARIIKLTGSEENVLRNYDSLNTKRRNILKKDKMLDSMTRAATGSTVYIGTAIMMFMMAKSMMAGLFTIGDFSIFITYLGTLTDCVNRIIELVTFSHQAEVSYERIVTAADEKQTSKLMQHPCIYAFEKQTDFTYEKENRLSLDTFSVKNLCYQNIISDISFHIRKGELLVICGEVGSGKSTVASALSGLIPVDCGELYWNQKSATVLSLTSPNIVLTPQNPGIFSTTIRENILLGYPASEEALQQSIHDAVFDYDLKQMEQGLDTLAGSRGDQLSGGQKQRLALARMFVRNPELCILDDSTSALDTATEHEFADRLLERLKAKKSACIVISNHQCFLQAATQILVLKAGRIADHGTAAELVERNTYFANIYRF